MTLPPKIATTPKPSAATDISQLPPCPYLDEEEGYEIDLRSGDIPGVTCKELPFCPLDDEEYEEYDFPIDLRKNSEPIPGVTCRPRPLPPCPFLDEEEGYALDLRSSSIPGVTCKELPLCPPDKVDSDENDLPIGPRKASVLIPGKTCIPLPPCPYLKEEEGYDIDLRSGFVPGVTCKELPFCPPDDKEYEDDDLSIDLRKNSELIPGLTCRPLPPCPYLIEEEGYDIDLRSYFVPGVTCKELPPCPTIQVVDNEEDIPQLDLRKSTELIPGVSCRPLPPCPLNFDQVNDSRNQLKPGKMRHYFTYIR